MESQTNQSDIGFEHAPVGLVVACHRVIQLCNGKLTRIFGYNRKDLVGQSLSLLYPSTEEFERIGIIGMKRMRGSGYYADERIMKRRSGELFWCRVRGQSLTPDDPFAHSVWSFVDLSDTRPIVALKRRERQVAMLMAEGHTSKEIARLLEISPRTVEAYRAALLAKLDARNSAELVARLSGVPL
jgi:PAS domain S-box-containing protein